jgi:hypothetical protein
MVIGSKQLRTLLFLILMFNLLFSACTVPGNTPSISDIRNETPSSISTSTAEAHTSSTPTPADTSTPTNTPSPTPLPGIWLETYLPETLVTKLQIPAGFNQVNESTQAQLTLSIGNGVPIARWIYTLVAPFPTIEDSVTQQDLISCWLAGTAPSNETGKLCLGFPLLLDQSTNNVFTALWGKPAVEAVKILPSDQLLTEAWKLPTSWAIVPFETLNPQWKVIEVDGQNPLWKEFIPENYPLSVDFSLDGTEELVKSFQEQLSNTLTQNQNETSNSPQTVVFTNRDPDKLTTVMLTGVTALVRATAETMRRKGNTYPARFIGPILQSADILHISNEIPFAERCPQPDPHQSELQFCSRPEYIELLDYIGTDVVELSGDHFADWGPEAMQFTIDMYRERNIPYYGGGENLEDGRKPYLVEHNGNKIAFLGCNAKGGGYATASETNPGAVECDPDWMRAEITRLRTQGYNVIVTFQHFEYYTYEAQPKQVTDFRNMADAGATIVSGSQAHQPQALEFSQEAFIHYGLGNLFFDQYFMGVPTSQGFLDRHVFYDNKHISTELIGIYFIDFASARLMSPEERQVLLESVFGASGW